MPELDSRQLVFIDETWAKSKLTHRNGRIPRDKLPVIPAQRGHWGATTFVAALRADGLTAPTVADGAINSDVFVAYVRQQLAPTFRPGDVVAMDNLSSPKRARIREAIEAAG